MPRFRPAVKSIAGAVLLLAAVAVAVGQEPGGTLVVLNRLKSCATLYDSASGKKIKSLVTSEGPCQLVVSYDGAIGIVTNYGLDEPGNTLSVVDIQNQTAFKMVDLGDYHRPCGIAFMPGGKRVLLAVEQENAVIAVDVENSTILDSVETGQRGTCGIAVNRRNSTAYVTHTESGSVSAVGLRPLTVKATIPTGPGASGIAVTPNGREVWVTNRDGDSLSIIDAESGAVAQTLPCKGHPVAVHISPDGRVALVAAPGSGEIAVWDVAARKETGRVPTGATPVADAGRRAFGAKFPASPAPADICFSPDGRFAYISNANADSISVYDVRSGKVTRQIQAEGEPLGLEHSRLVLVTPPDPGQADDASVPELEATAQQQIAAGQWVEAAATYKRITERDPANGAAWVMYATTTHRAGDPEGAIKLYQHAKQFADVRPTACYNLACAYVFRKDHDAAIASLREAVDAGFKNAQVLESDADLAPIRSDPRFAELVAKVKQVPGAVVTNPKYRELDFRVGSWTVTDLQGNKLGASIVEKGMNGFMLSERWNTPAGAYGISLNYFDSAADTWKQVWFDHQGNVIQSTGRFSDGTLQMEGTRTTPAGAATGYRMRCTPESSDRLRMVIEQSADDGKSWGNRIETIYVRNG